jgi:hypothetical protein
MKLDAGKLGRSYMLGLWLCIAALIPIVVARWFLKHPAEPLNRTGWNSIAIMSGVALLDGFAARGVWRRRAWGYYLSLLISAYWAFNGAYDFFARPLANAPRWTYAIPFIFGAVALMWLTTPALRSQFSLAFRKAKVV